MTMQIRKATRDKARLRMAIDGPSGAGKTMTGLRLATSIGGKIGVIDTEHGSASLYVGEDMDGKPCQFDCVELQTFNPSNYVAAIDAFARAGYPVLLIDSLSHAWEGVEGALEMVSRKEGNSYTAWRDVTPVHRRMVEAILTYPGDVICTMRSKTEYVLETNDKGKQVPRKIGVAPIQRPGMEYEFTVYASIDIDHFLKVTKSRCSAMDGAICHKPGAGFMQPLLAWLRTGAAPVVEGPRIVMASDAQLAEIGQLSVELDKVHKIFRAQLFRRFSVEHLHQLTGEQADSVLAELRSERAGKVGQAVQPAVAGSRVAGKGDGKDQAAQPGQTLQAALADVHGEVVASDARRAETDRSVIINRIAIVRDSWYALKGLPDESTPDGKAQRTAAWGAVCAKRGVKSIKELPTPGLLEIERNLEAAVARMVEERRRMNDSATGSPPEKPLAEGVGPMAFKGTATVVAQEKPPAALPGADFPRQT